MIFIDITQKKTKELPIFFDFLFSVNSYTILRDKKLEKIFLELKKCNKVEMTRKLFSDACSRNLFSQVLMH
jgi:hypothetical protein